VTGRKAEFLLIGGGIASATCAAALRRGGAEGSILLVGREPTPPYHRPPITKGYLRGEETEQDTLVRPAEWWEDHGVELLTRTSVMSLDAGTRVAKLSNKEEVEFNRALIATGAMVRRLRCDGADLDGIHYLRALGNAVALANAAREAEHVVVIGGSYVGCEVAASLTEMGKSCTILMQEGVTLERGFGRRAGRYFQDVLEARGVKVVGDDEVERFVGGGAAAEGMDAVASVVTRAGRELPADCVVAGVGAMPDVMLARKAGLELGETGGVSTDGLLETSVPGIFAAGDMCEYDSVIHGRRLRIEHEDVAATQGEAAALNMLGSKRPYDTVPYFFAHLSDWASLEYVGPALSWDEEVLRGSTEEGAFSIWYLERGSVRGVLSVGRAEDLDEGRRMIRSGQPMEGR